MRLAQVNAPKWRLVRAASLQTASELKPLSFISFAGPLVKTASIPSRSWVFQIEIRFNGDFRLQPGIEPPAFRPCSCPLLLAWLRVLVIRTMQKVPIGPHSMRSCMDAERC
jgi:hypothetical protein